MNRNLSLSLFLSFVLGPAAFAQEEYGKPTGEEDPYGEIYEIKLVPESMTEILDEEGRFVVPSFINATIYRGEQECWVTSQIPAAGTVLTCEQGLMVQLEYTCGGGEQNWARLPITLVDNISPEIQVLLDSNSQPHLSFGGIARYLMPAVVAPVVTVFDACGPAIEELLLDGQPHTLGQAVSSEGLHFLSVTGIDAAGNRSYESVVFEIRERPSHTAQAVVESTECEIAPDGQSGTIRATILASPATFDHRDVLFSSVDVMLRGADGTYLNDSPIPIAAIPEINDCWVAFDVEAPFLTQAGACPAELIIVGATTANGTVAIEWGARVANIADPTPVPTLLALVGKQEPCGDPQPPPAQSPPSCDAIETVLFAQNACATGAIPATGPGCGPASGTGAELKVFDGVPFKGSATAEVTALPGGSCGVITGECGPLTGGLVEIMQFVGNCCECAVTYSVVGARVAPELLASGTGDFWAYASASGTITVIPPCGPAGVSANSASILFSSNVTPPENPLLPPASSLTPPVNCTEVGCHTSVMLVIATGHVIAKARASAGGTAAAKAILKGQIQTISANPTFVECNP